MKLQNVIKKLERDLQDARAELEGAYDCWNACEEELRAGLQAFEDMLDEEAEASWVLTQMLADSEAANWELTEFLAELLAENSVLGQRIKEQGEVIAELSAELATVRPQVL